MRMVNQEPGKGNASPMGERFEDRAEQPLTQGHRAPSSLQTKRNEQRLYLRAGQTDRRTDGQTDGRADENRERRRGAHRESRRRTRIEIGVEQAGETREVFDDVSEALYAAVALVECVLRRQGGGVGGEGRGGERRGVNKITGAECEIDEIMEQTSGEA